MQTPPPISENPYGQQPRQKPNNTLTIVLWIVAACFILMCLAAAAFAAILYPVFKQAKTSAVKAACLSNVKQQDLGLIMYSADWDDTMPPAAAWMDNINPYIKSESVFHCPGIKDRGFGNGYAFNDLLNKMSVVKIAEPMNCVSIFETSQENRNFASHSDTLPKPSRHSLNNIGYADGHASSKPVSWVPTMDQDPKKPIRP